MHSSPRRSDPGLDHIAQLLRHGEIDSRDLAGYIAAMAGEMTAMAQLGDLRTLAYLTDMVRLEAENQCQSGQGAKPSGPPS